MSLIPTFGESSQAPTVGAKPQGHSSLSPKPHLPSVVHFKLIIVRLVPRHGPLAGISDWKSSVLLLHIFQSCSTQMESLVIPVRPDTEEEQRQEAGPGVWFTQNGLVSAGITGKAFQHRVGAAVPYSPPHPEMFATSLITPSAAKHLPSACQARCPTCCCSPVASCSC